MTEQKKTDSESISIEDFDLKTRSVMKAAGLDLEKIIRHHNQVTQQDQEEAVEAGPDPDRSEDQSPPLTVYEQLRADIQSTVNTLYEAYTKKNGRKPKKHQIPDLRLQAILGELSTIKDSQQAMAAMFTNLIETHRADYANLLQEHKALSLFVVALLDTVFCGDPQEARNRISQTVMVNHLQPIVELDHEFPFSISLYKSYLPELFDDSKDEEAAG